MIRRAGSGVKLAIPDRNDIEISRFGHSLVRNLTPNSIQIRVLRPEKRRILSFWTPYSLYARHARCQSHIATRSQRGSARGSQRGSQRESQRRSQIRSQVRSQSTSQLKGESESQTQSQSRSETRSQVERQSKSQLKSQRRSQSKSQVRSQRGSAPWATPGQGRERENRIFQDTNGVFDRMSRYRATRPGRTRNDEVLMTND